MPIDASIISGLKPPAPIELQDPVTSYAKGLQLKTLMGQQQLQGLQIQQAQQGMDEDQAARTALKSAVGPNGEFDQGGYLKNLAGSGAVKQFQAERKAQLDAREKLANIDAKEAETLNKTLDGWKALIPQVQTRDDAIAWTRAQRKDPKIGPHMAQMGSEDQQIANIPNDPAGLEAWKLKQQNGMKAYQDSLNQNANRVETGRHNLATEGNAAVGRQQEAEKIGIERYKADPYGLGLGPAAGAPIPGAAPSGGLPAAPGGMPVNPSPPGRMQIPQNVQAQRDAERIAILEKEAQNFPNDQALAAELANAKSGRNYAGLSSGASTVSGVTPDGRVPQGAPQVANPRVDMTLTGDDFIKQLPPALASEVKAYAEGRRPFPSGMAGKSPAVQQMMQMVAAYDPTFDATDYNKRNKTATGFATGKQGDAVKAINQAINHAGSLNDTIDKLDNSNMIGANLALTPISNAFQRHVLNDPTQGEFKQNATALASELRKVFAGSGGGNLTELKQWEEGLPLNESKQQQKAYLKKGIELLNGGIEALNDQYRSGFGTNANILQNDSLIKPKAREILNRLTGGQGAAPNSDLHAKAQAIINGNR